MATTTMTETVTNLINVESPEHFQQLLSKDLSRISLLNFWAPWAAPCEQMNEVVHALAQRHPNVLVLQVEAETQQDIAESFEIVSVPTFVILRGHTLLSRVEGADAARLTKDIALHAHTPQSGLAKTDRVPASASATNGAHIDGLEEETEEQLNKRLKELMNQSRVVLFMKGEPDAPRCGFSRTIVGLLRENKVDFTHFDILTDESVRSGLKELNNWPTFPQLIVGGEFVGGLDIVKEMIASNEFHEIVKA